MNTAPHFGHLILVSPGVPHPKEKIANIANAKMILTILFINFTSFHSVILIRLPVNTDLSNNKIPCWLSRKKCEIGSIPFRYFFFDFGFLVVFVAFPWVFPQVMVQSPPPERIKLFIPLNLLFVKKIFFSYIGAERFNSVKKPCFKRADSFYAI